MTIQQTSWPVKDAYDHAILQRAQTVFDPDLRAGTLAMDQGRICQYGGANLYVRLYRVGDWLVRCFCSDPQRRPPGDIVTRYQAIDRFSRTYEDRVPVLLPVRYLEQGIRIDSQVLPLVKMRFCDAPRLGRFVEHHYKDPSRMRQLCDAWLSMMQMLRNVSMAHGDLDLTNVLVLERGKTLALKLIDYDNMWIPALAGSPQTEYGHEHFQHPIYTEPYSRPYNAEMDRFSALVIYLSLEILVTHPHLYDDWTADELHRLLLSQTDYTDYIHDRSADNRIVQLDTLCRSERPELVAYLDALRQALENGSLPPALDRIKIPRPPRIDFGKVTFVSHMEQTPEPVRVGPLSKPSKTVVISKARVRTPIVVVIALLIIAGITILGMMWNIYPINKLNSLFHALFSLIHDHLSQIQRK